MNREEEPAAVEKLAMRLENLGEKHPLYALAQELRTFINASLKAILAYQESVQVLKACETECEMARTALRRQYEVNYLDARKQLGRALAERLFPALNTRSKSDKTSADAGEAITAIS